jgi:hypothetical protein
MRQETGLGVQCFVEHDPRGQVHQRTPRRLRLLHDRWVTVVDTEPTSQARDREPSLLPGCTQDSVQLGKCDPSGSLGEQRQRESDARWRYNDVLSARAKGQRDSPDARARGDDIRRRLVRAVVHSGASCVAAVTGNSHARDHAANDRRIRRNFEARQFVNYG